MKKLIILLTFLGMCSASYAKTFDDWSNEDLCRWIDALQVPDPILMEIEIRDLVCMSSPEIIEVSITEPTPSEYGTLFPSPSSQNNSHKNTGSGIRFIFNYKFKL
jgi:hypothetical protein